MFCTRRVKRDNVPHERMIARMAKALLWPPCRLGEDVCDLLPDIEFFINDVRYLGEADTGHVKKPQVQCRWKKYARAQEELQESNPNDQLDTVLVVTNSEDRLQDLLEWSEQIAEFGCFTTLDELTADPFGRVWHQIGQEKREKLIEPVGKVLDNVLQTC